MSVITLHEFNTNPSSLQQRKSISNGGTPKQLECFDLLCVSLPSGQQKHFISQLQPAGYKNMPFFISWEVHKFTVTQL